MSYIIVALVYIIFSGQTPVPGPMTFHSTTNFKDMDSCKAFLLSAEFQAQRAVLASMIAASVPKQKTESGEETDDGAVVPGVAITASCEEDHSL